MFSKDDKAYAPGTVIVSNLAGTPNAKNILRAILSYSPEDQIVILSIDEELAEMVRGYNVTAPWFMDGPNPFEFHKLDGGPSEVKQIYILSKNVGKHKKDQL